MIPLLGKSLENLSSGGVNVRMKDPIPLKVRNANSVLFLFPNIGRKFYIAQPDVVMIKSFINYAGKRK